jgi:hypothetical protein
MNIGRWSYKVSTAIAAEMRFHRIAVGAGWAEFQNLTATLRTKLGRQVAVKSTCQTLHQRNLRKFDRSMYYMHASVFRDF